MSVILVVDDEEDIRELVGIYLKNEGMQVCKAANGKEALECLEKMDIDLAILDIMMADMDGITLCMEIRKKSNLPIIMLSAKDQDMDKVLGLTAGQTIILQSRLIPLNWWQGSKRSCAAVRNLTTVRQKCSGISGFIHESGNTPCLFKCKRSLFNTERICHFRTAVEE